MADLDLAALRERVARIIEPEAWGDFDKMHGGGWRRENIAHAVVADSEEKAEAILAALSPLLDRLARAEADVGRLREAVKVGSDAINEMFRYFDGGETRGSYDGRPERDQLRKAGYRLRATLTETDHAS